VSERIEAIRKDVEEHAGCSATHFDSTPVTEGYLDQIIWEGVVETFELHGLFVSLYAYHSAKSPACSCVSITLPASS